MLRIYEHTVWMRAHLRQAANLAELDDFKVASWLRSVKKSAMADASAYHQPDDLWAALAALEVAQQKNEF